MFKKISKFISYLIVLGIQVAYNLFVIWGLHMWDFASPWISHRTTIILLALPTMIVFNIVLMIFVAIAFFSLVKKEEEKKGFKVPDKVTSWFKGESKEEKEFKIPEKIISEIKKEWDKEMAKKDKE
ncbi:MAG: hypothetical protein GNW80_14130 [Asgard group archaeon]|nr:hypothetical protein [Asgard group archaeon]